MIHLQINNILINNDIIPNVLSTIVREKSNENWSGLTTNKVGLAMILGIVLKGPAKDKL